VSEEDETGAAEDESGTTTSDGAADDVPASTDLLDGAPVGPAAGDETSNAERGARDDRDDSEDDVPGLGEEVAGLEQEADRNPVLSLIAAAGDRPAALIGFVLMLALGGWWLVARRRVLGEEESEG
jgi:hypothetical protein